MSFEPDKSKSGAVVLKCDVPNCPTHVLGMDEEHAQECADLAGFITQKVDGGANHVCHDCQSSPGKARARQMLGGARAIVPAPGPLKKGDSVYHPVTGECVGVAMHDVSSPGEALEVDVTPPPEEERTPPSPHAFAASVLYDEGDEQYMEPDQVAEAPSVVYGGDDDGDERSGDLDDIFADIIGGGPSDDVN